ncbi:hypothetical protein C8J56DRAFT_895027 [Mycena floridula]|nr:hypothetical protein C8J56DRAFT_895027 [Mycena floridula]
MSSCVHYVDSEPDYPSQPIIPTRPPIAIPDPSRYSNPATTLLRSADFAGMVSVKETVVVSKKKLVRRMKKAIIAAKTATATNPPAPVFNDPVGVALGRAEVAVVGRGDGRLRETHLWGSHRLSTLLHRTAGVADVLGVVEVGSEGDEGVTAAEAEVSVDIHPDVQNWNSKELAFVAVRDSWLRRMNWLVEEVSSKNICTLTDGNQDTFMSVGKLKALIWADFGFLMQSHTRQRTGQNVVLFIITIGMYESALLI